MPSNFGNNNFGTLFFRIADYENSPKQLSYKQTKALIRNQKAAEKLFNQEPVKFQVIFALLNEILGVLISLIHFLF